VGAEGSAVDGTTVRVLPQGRYWVGLFGSIAVVAGWLLLLALTQDEPEEDPVVAAAGFGVAVLMTVSMSRVTMYGTPTHLVVRNLAWKRPIGWTRIESFDVKPFRFSRFYAASVVAHTDIGVDVRLWASMTMSRRRAAEIATALEHLAAEHGIPADIDPEWLRCLWT